MIFDNCGIGQASGTSFAGRGIVDGSWDLFAIHRLAYLQGRLFIGNAHGLPPSSRERHSKILKLVGITDCRSWAMPCGGPSSSTNSA